MAREAVASANVRKLASDQIAAKGLKMAAAGFGVAPQTLQRVAAGQPVMPDTLEQITPKIRRAEDFVARPAVAPPIRTLASSSWTLEQIHEARSAQMRGHFHDAVRLALAMRCDDALYVAYHNRIAPQSAVLAELTAAASKRGAAVAARAALSCFVSRSVLAGVDGTLANHGLAIGYNIQQASEDGTRIDFHHVEWPLEFVQWRPTEGLLYTQVRNGGQMEPIIHGDGRWTIYRKFTDRPWLQEAAILPGSLIYAAHANGVSDWASASRAQGMAKVIGELPEGVSLQGSAVDGTPILSPDATAMLTMLANVVSGQSDVGIRPSGSKTDVLATASTAWQVFDTWLQNREKAAARVYLGTDGTLGASGGAPGVDIATLFGVATTKVQGDLSALEQGLSVGLYQPWTAVNVGDSRYAPSLIYHLPDPDAEKNSANNAAQVKRLTDTLKEYRALNLTITQAVINDLSERFNVPAASVPQLGATTVQQLVVSDAQLVQAMRIYEIRAAGGFGPMGDARDNMTLNELDAATKAQGDVSTAVVKANPGTGGVVVPGMPAPSLPAKPPPGALPPPANDGTP